MDKINILTTLQNELKAPKSKYNKFGKYNYRTCEDILEAVKPLLKEHGCTLSIDDEIVMIGDRFYVKSSCHFATANKEFHMKTSGFAREELNKSGMAGAQITGAASSYARKYALNGLFLIDDTKDADSQEPYKKVEEPAKQPQPKRYKVTIDKVFKNPDEKTIEDLRTFLETDNAPALALQYFSKLAEEFYHDQSELIGATL